MDRRQALKGLGLSMGYMVATPAVLSILQSCKNDAKGEVAWAAEFFTPDEATVVENLVNLILPPTEDLPGAKDVNVTQFIDIYTAKVSSQEEQDAYRQGLSAVMNALGKPAKDLKNDDYDALLSKYLKADKEQLAAINNNESEKAVLQTLSGLRGSAIWAYKTSKKVGEEVLAYDPIPGEQKGCISLEEATGGRAWSL